MEPAFVNLRAAEYPENLNIELPASKSESNRALILNALSGNSAEILNSSKANDTIIMERLLSAAKEIYDAEDAGTVMRFMTAYLALTTKKEVLLTGSERMQDRPIELLVDALTRVGSNIKYEKKSGFPPLRIFPFSNQLTNKVSINGDVSSQYISAMLMIAPLLPRGLELTLKGKIASKPYIEMTLDLIKQFGIDYQFQENVISVASQSFIPSKVKIENDWSAASYWYSVLAISDHVKSITLEGLKEHSLQGDSILSFMMQFFGIETHYHHNSIVLRKSGSPQQQLYWDFSDCPDLAQTIAVICAEKGMEARFTGIESLKIKETDRIKAINSELQKLGSGLVEESSGIWKIEGKIDTSEQNVVINTYKDHRMAMAFAPLGCKMDLSIENPGVVKKSYPNFWEELKKTGIQLD